MQELQQLLNQSGTTCVIRHEGEIRVFQNRGIQDLYTLYQTEPRFLKKASVADKVIGKAAATILLLGGVTELYTPLISDLALELLTASPMKISYEHRVSHIINRQRNGWCPLEKATHQLKAPDEIWNAITQFMQQHL